MKKFIISAFAATAFFMFAAASDASACSCMVDNEQSNVQQIQDSYEKADAVFYGKVIEVKRQTVKSETPGAGYQLLRVKFRVEMSWKGQTTRVITVRTAGNSAACGFAFKAGKRYLVYAGGGGDGLQTTNCSRTSALNSDAKFLDKIKKPKLFSGK
jgi:hypothetical protein